MAPIDPGALLEMEKSARHVATEMLHVMDNLRNSLYAVSPAPDLSSLNPLAENCGRAGSQYIEYSSNLASSPRRYQDYRLVSVVRDCAGIPVESDTHLYTSQYTNRTVIDMRKVCCAIDIASSPETEAFKRRNGFFF